MTHLPRIKLNDHFGQLTILENLGNLGKKHGNHFRCRCTCGNETVARGSHLKDGKTKSCGCGRVDSEPWKVSARVAYKPYSDGDITFEKFLQLARLPCHYCDAPPSNKQGAPKPGQARGRKTVADNRAHLYEYVYQGLDRVDSSKGHDLDNCVPCCSTCNTAKMDLGYDAFLDHVNRIYRYRVRNSKKPGQSFDCQALLAIVGY